MSIQEIKAELETMPADDRRKLSAYLVSLRHRDLAGYRETMARRIDDVEPGNWLTREEMEKRLES